MIALSIYRLCPSDLNMWKSEFTIIASFKNTVSDRVICPLKEFTSLSHPVWTNPKHLSLIGPFFIYSSSHSVFLGPALAQGACILLTLQLLAFICPLKELAICAITHLLWATQKHPSFIHPFFHNTFSNSRLSTLAILHWPCIFQYPTKGVIDPLEKLTIRIVPHVLWTTPKHLPLINPLSNNCLAYSWLFTLAILP